MVGTSDEKLADEVRAALGRVFRSPESSARDGAQ
jgi:hypothetical protein